MCKGKIAKGTEEKTGEVISLQKNVWESINKEYIKGYYFNELSLAGRLRGIPIFEIERVKIQNLARGIHHKKLNFKSLREIKELLMFFVDRRFKFISLNVIG